VSPTSPARGFKYQGPGSDDGGFKHQEVIAAPMRVSRLLQGVQAPIRGSDGELIGSDSSTMGRCLDKEGGAHAARSVTLSSSPRH